MILYKIISGGQIGADRAGLVAAKKSGLQTGGCMPLGFFAKDGNHPEFERLYNMTAHSSAKYPPRTAVNAKESSGTMRFATNWKSPGEVLTLNMATRYGKPCFDVDILAAISGDERYTPTKAAEWIDAKSIEVLNVAGNADATIEEFVTEFLLEMIRILRNNDADRNSVDGD